MIFNVALSPCPNDTFPFHAWIEGNLPSAPKLDVTYADIDHLNTFAKEASFPFMKVSFGVLPRIFKNYDLLPVGAALGFNCGPLIVALDKQPIQELLKKPLAIPGIDTTAYLLLKTLIGTPEHPVFCTYEKIPELIKNGTVASGLIIHETRFTLDQWKLRKIEDLGELWHSKTNLPLPLGGLVVRKDVSQKDRQLFITSFQESLQQAWDDPKKSATYVLQHSQEKQTSVVQQHIDLYVSQESMSLSELGKKAINRLLHPLKPYVFA